jgi:hypothetical protein
VRCVASSSTRQSAVASAQRDGSKSRVSVANANGARALSLCRLCSASSLPPIKHEPQPEHSQSTSASATVNSAEIAARAASGAVARALSAAASSSSAPNRSGARLPPIAHTYATTHCVSALIDAHHLLCISPRRRTASHVEQSEAYDDYDDDDDDELPMIYSADEADETDAANNQRVLAQLPPITSIVRQSSAPTTTATRQPRRSLVRVAVIFFLPAP